MCWEGSLVSNMCAGGKDRELHVPGGKNGWTDVCWRESLSKLRASPSSAHQKREIGQAFPAAQFFECSCPPAHTYSGSFSFGCENGRLQNFPGLSSQLNSRDADCFKLFYRFLNDTVLLANSDCKARRSRIRANDSGNGFCEGFR